MMNYRWLAFTLALAVLMPHVAVPQSFSDGFYARLGKGNVEQVDFSADGSLLAARGQRGISLYDAHDLTLLRFWDGTESARVMAVSPEGALLAWGDSEGDVHLWDIDTGQPVTILEGLQRAPEAIAWDGQGQHIAAADRDQVYIWDVATTKVVREIPAEWPDTLALSHNAEALAIAASGEVIQLWDVKTGEPIASLKGHLEGVKSLVFSPDSRLLASGGVSSAIRLWDLESHETVAVLVGHYNSVTSLDFSPDARLLASAAGQGSDSGVRLWNATTGTRLANLDAHAVSAHSVAFSPDGTALVSAGTDSILLWDVATQQVKRSADPFMDRVISLAFSPDGRTLAVGSGDTTIRIWDLVTKKQTWLMADNSSSIDTLMFRPDGMLFAAQEWPHRIRLWALSSQPPSIAWQFAPELYAVTAFSADGKTIAVGDRDGNIQLYHAPTKQQLAEFQGFGESIGKLTFNRDGRLLVSRDSQGRADIWNLETGESVASWQSGWVRQMAFNAESNRIATVGSGSAVYLRDAATGERLISLRGHKGNVTSVAFSPDGQLLATGAEDGIRLWRMDTNEEESHLDAGSITSVAFSPKGNMLAAGGRDGTVLLWGLPDAVSVEPAGRFRTAWGSVKRSVLLQNYPNPSNPETWIPFILAEEADVEVTIFDEHGRTVRRISLGRIAAGDYTTRGKAIRWDGTNRDGQLVASGAYVYELSAGTFTAVRRMLITR